VRLFPTPKHRRSGRRHIGFAPQIKGGIKNFGGLGLLFSASTTDRLLAYESQSQQFVSEPRRAIFSVCVSTRGKRLKPELSREAPPTFTPEQRARLMQEVYATFEPVAATRAAHLLSSADRATHFSRDAGARLSPDAND
jgi:hypothetical protein